MSYERWLKDRLIKKQAPDHDQINKQLNRASKDLRTAEAISSIDRTWSFTIAYHAMIRAGRAFMFSKGYLPTTLSAHKTIVEFTREALGSPYGDLVLRFDRMRRKRHDFIYNSENNTTEREALAAIRTAQDLIRRIGECLGDEYFKKLI
jgi:uncharacterized protein (UPF0332 family)